MVILLMIAYSRGIQEINRSTSVLSLLSSPLHAIATSTPLPNGKRYNNTTDIVPTLIDNEHVDSCQLLNAINFSSRNLKLTHNFAEEAMRQSNETFAEAIKSSNESMKSFGESMCRSIELLAALLAISENSNTYNNKPKHVWFNHGEEGVNPPCVFVEQF